jgi:hypothetical protein
MHKLEPLIREVVPIPERIYAVTKRANTPEEVKRYFPGFRVLIDAYQVAFDIFSAVFMSHMTNYLYRNCRCFCN